MRHPILLGALALLLAGCAAAPTLVEPEGPATYPHHTLDQILAETQAVAEGDAIASFTTQGRLALRSPEQNADVGVTLRARGDTLWASLRGPLNIEVARLLATSDSFFVHDRLRNQLVAGPAEAAQAVLPGPVGPEELRRSLIGTVVPNPGVRYFVNAATVDGEAAYWLTAPDGQLRIAVSAASWRVLRYERLERGRVVDRRLYGAFASVEGRRLPRTVELSSPATETSVTIEHRQTALNVPGMTFPFTPGSAQRVAPGAAAPISMP